MKRFDIGLLPKAVDILIKWAWLQYPAPQLLKWRFAGERMCGHARFNLKLKYKQYRHLKALSKRFFKCFFLYNFLRSIVSLIIFSSRLGWKVRLGLFAFCAKKGGNKSGSALHIRKSPLHIWNSVDWPRGDFHHLSGNHQPLGENPRPCLFRPPRADSPAGLGGGPAL